MKRQELLIWAAGLFEGCGGITIEPQQGPTKKYLSMTLTFPTHEPSQVKRLEAVLSNGSQTQYGFEIGGYAAIRGFFHEIWPYVSPGGKSQINEALKFYKGKRDYVQNQAENPD